jgi:serine/threonine protein kinase
MYGKISFKSDIYSLGVIIIEMLTSEKGYPDVKDVRRFHVPTYNEAGYSLFILFFAEYVFLYESHSLSMT